ncbi:MAG: hypothetical protein KDC38_16335 [Planctomycetes bacterium]|nr:hypothetical protein [Planctomycetota bacterium]
MLSRDEIRELLSPLRPEAPGQRAPVLVLTDRPEDSEAIARVLTRRDVSVVPAKHAYAALDWFKQRPYAAVVASARCLDVEARAFVARLREIDPKIVIYVISERDEVPDLDGVHLFSRPLSEGQLLELADRVAPRSSREGVERASASSIAESSVPRPSGATNSPGEAAPVETVAPTAGEMPIAPGSLHETVEVRPPTPVRENTAVGFEPTPGTEVRGAVLGSGAVNETEITARETSGRPRYDPSLPLPTIGISAILSSRLAGGDLEAGLRRWIHEDECVTGLATLRLDLPSELESPGTIGLGSAGYSCRAVALSPVDRQEILRAVGDELREDLFEDEVPVQVRGRFLVFAEPDRRHVRWAIYAPRLAEDRHGAERIAEQLRPVLPELRRVAPAGPRAAAPVDPRSGSPTVASGSLTGAAPREDLEQLLASVVRRLDDLTRQLR